MGKFKQSRNVSILFAMSVLLMLLSSMGGILLDDNGSFEVFTSIRGQDITIYGGEGLYRFDDMSKAVAFRGFDWANLFVGLPVFILGMVYYRMGYLRGQFILAAFFAYLAYNYLIGVMGNTFNCMFLVWTALYSCGLFGLALVLVDFDICTIGKRLEKVIPAKLLAGYMFFLGIFLFFSYLNEVIGAFILDMPPQSLSHYTTLELASLELGIMIPLHIIGGGLLLKKKAAGYLLAAVLAFTACMTFLSLSVGQILTYFFYHSGTLLDVVVMVCLALVTMILSLLIFSRLREPLPVQSN